jgi:hypothetical protein
VAITPELATAARIATAEGATDPVMDITVKTMATLSAMSNSTDISVANRKKLYDDLIEKATAAGAGSLKQSLTAAKEKITSSAQLYKESARGQALFNKLVNTPLNTATNPDTGEVTYMPDNDKEFASNLRDINDDFLSRLLLEAEEVMATRGDVSACACT